MSQKPRRQNATELRNAQLSVAAASPSIESVVNPTPPQPRHLVWQRTSTLVVASAPRTVPSRPATHSSSWIPSLEAFRDALVTSEPIFHLGLEGHRFVRSCEGAYPCYRVSGLSQDQALARMLPLDLHFPEKNLESEWRAGPVRTSASAALGYVDLLRVVLLLCLPHRQHNRCDAASNRQFRQVRLCAVL